MNTAEIEKWGRWRISWLSPTNSEDVRELLLAGEIDGVGINPHRPGCGGRRSGGSNITPPSDLPALAGLVVTDCINFDFAVLGQFSQTRFLTFGGDRTQPIDFRIFPNLVDLRIRWQKKDILPSGNTLEALYLAGYKPKPNKNVESLPLLGNLHELELVQAGIVNLEGIQRYTKLHTLDVSYCRSLESIAALSGTRVERLDLEACGRIGDIEVIADCPNLRSVRMSGCGDMKSLKFIDRCKSLEEFRFVRMNVLDGDMRPLLRLRSVGFTNKRGYSHTSEEIKSIICGAPN